MKNFQDHKILEVRQFVVSRFWHARSSVPSRIGRWRHILAIPVLGRWWKNNQKVKASLGYMRSCLKIILY